MSRSGKNRKKEILKNIRKINILLLVAMIIVLIAGTPAVLYFSGNTLTDILKLLPLIIFLLLAFILYSAARNDFINKSVLTPLYRLTRNVSEARFDDADFFDSDHKDEIHDLARAIQDVVQEQHRQEQLLYAVNSAAFVLLATTEEKDFEASLLKGMNIMGSCVNADQVYIMRNEMIGGEHCFVYRYEWLNETGKTGTRGVAVPYSKFPDWEIRFARGEYLNGPISEQSPSIQKYFSRVKMKSLLVIPVFIQDNFWGLFSFTDYRTERTFTKDEVNILRSAALMLVTAVNHNTQGVELNEAHQLTQVLLDTMPFSCQLWNRDYKIFDCNEETVKLLKTGNKQNFIDWFYDFSPEYQSDGQSSREKAMMLLRTAFEEGICVFEWMHQQLNGRSLPMEIVLVRIPHGEDYIVASYGRDLREYKRMMKEIERRDYLLNTTNKAAATLLQSELSEFMNGLYQVMAMVAEAVSVNRVRIWKNRVTDGKLCLTLIFEWPEGYMAQQNNEITVDMPYEYAIPWWEKILAQGDYINSLVKDMPAEVQAQLLFRGILSMFVVPVFVRNEFWGFVGYDDCDHERLFTEDEQSIMRSVSFLMTSAWLRNEMTLDIRATAARQKAVFSNYPGIIWCVDRARTITLFDGFYLNEYGISSSFFEGRKTYEAFRESWSLGINESIQKTFAGGNQDTTIEIDGKMFRIRTTPIYNDEGVIINVVGSFDDITERIRLQAELKAALIEAQDANRAKTSFLAKMSHEMRTPLNAVIGLSELTLEDGILSNEVRGNLIKISNAGATLLSTVNDILDISKIEAGKFELITEDYDIPNLINDAIAQSILRIGEKPVKFILNISENLPACLHGDEHRVKQIINNLLSNAFKYTRQGTVELTVSCEREEEIAWMTLRVGDTGIGIRKEDMEKLFADYAMVDMESHREIEGTGLGLPITKNIVEIMGGAITVESEYRKGTVFTARFKQEFVNDAVIGAELAETLKSFRYSDEKRRQNSQIMRIDLSYAHVLVVDDVLTNLDVAKGMMKPYGMQIDCVSRGQDAIDAVRAEKVRYNAIFMDHMMPDMNGIEATRIIREKIRTEYAKTVPIIALTANAIVGNDEMFLKNGFQAFISKPIEMSRLDTVLRQWVMDKDREEKLIDNTKEQPEGAAREFSARLDGVDVQKGFERFNRDINSFLNVLRSYAANTPSFFDSFKDVNKDNLADYAIGVHGIKGSSRGICAEVIGAKAEALEKAARAGDIDFVIANNAELIEAARKLVNDIKDLLGKMASESPKPKKDKPDGQVLSKLIAACEQYNMDEADSAMKEIDNYEYESDDGLAQWLRENVDMMNFSEIKEKLTAMIPS
jgi:signal transduction histidine kinase/FixJ family two-component response regulator